MVVLRFWLTMLPPSLIRCLGGLGVAGLLTYGSPGLAQSEVFILKSGSQVGPTTEVKPKNCVTAQDGSITCETELVNPPGNTPAKPQFNPFRN
jgi:hypothetical protein